MSSIGRRQMECSHPGCKADAGLFFQHWNAELGKSVCQRHALELYQQEGLEPLLVKYGVPNINYRAEALLLHDMSYEEAEAIGKYTVKQGYLRAKSPFRKGGNLWKSWMAGFGGGA